VPKYSVSSSSNSAAKRSYQDNAMFDVKKLPKLPRGLGQDHPLRNKDAMEHLKRYCFARIEFAKNFRDDLAAFMECVDKDVAGYINLSEEDKKRLQDRYAGKSLKPTEMNLPLIYLQLDDAMTYFSRVFAPESGIFSAVATANKQDLANGFTSLMNQHAQDKGYYRDILRFCFDALKYNLAGFRVTWEKDYGNKITNGVGKVAKVTEDVVWEGNDLVALDMYNTMWDPSVHPCEVNRLGEFFVEVDMITPFRAVQMAYRGELYNLNKIMNPDCSMRGSAQYYRIPPDIRAPITNASDTGSRGGYNWINILSAGEFTGVMGSGMELITQYIKLIPSMFGLSDSKKLEVWRLIWGNGEVLMKADHMPNAHGMLPCSFATPIEDGLGLQQKSIASILAPLQVMGSFIMNTHVTSVRKNIWDLILYDPTMVDLASIKDDVAARVPVNAAAYGKDIRTFIWQNTNLLDTASTFEQLRNLVGLMQQLFPTQSLLNTQIADMDRAVNNQVAAAVQGTNMRLQKMAKLMDVQAFHDVRHIMLFNILEYQPEITIYGPNGEEQLINPAEFRDANLRFVIGEGLKTLDRMSVITNLRSMVNSIIQSQQASQQFQLPQLLDYLGSLMGEQTNMTQFAVVQQPGNQGLNAGQAPQPAQTAR
jgi:hypothetical protein